MSTTAPLTTSDNYGVHRALCSLRAMHFQVILDDNATAACVLRTPNGKEIALFLSEIEGYAAKMREDFDAFKRFLEAKKG